MLPRACGSGAAKRAFSAPALLSRFALTLSVEIRSMIVLLLPHCRPIRRVDQMEDQLILGMRSALGEQLARLHHGHIRSESHVEHVWLAGDWLVVRVEGGVWRGEAGRGRWWGLGMCVCERGIERSCGDEWRVGGLLTVVECSIDHMHMLEERVLHFIDLVMHAVPIDVPPCGRVVMALDDVEAQIVTLHRHLPIEVKHLAKHRRRLEVVSRHGSVCSLSPQGGLQVPPRLLLTPGSVFWLCHRQLCEERSEGGGEGWRAARVVEHA